MKGFLGFSLFVVGLVCYAQKQSVADSLKALYRSSKEIDRLEILYDILDHEQNPDSTVHYATLYLELSKASGDIEKIHGAYTKLASKYNRKGDLEKALEYYYKALNVADSESLKAITYSNLGSVYQYNKDFPNAYLNYDKAAKIFLKLNDSLRVGATYISFGYALYLDNQLDTAAYYLEQAKNIYAQLNHPYHDYYWSYAAGNMALVDAKKGLIEESEQTLDTAITILRKYGDDYAVSEYLLELAKIYALKGLKKSALQHALEGTNLARKNDYKKFIVDGSELLSQLYADLNNFSEAYRYQSDFIKYNDSLINADLVRKLANQRTEFEVGQKQAEVDLLLAEKRTQRIITIAVAGFAFILIVLAAVIYSFYRSKSKTNKILAEQKSELERLNKTKDKFFSIISHDLRSPVAGFHGISQMIKMMVASGQTQQLIEMTKHIDASVDQLSKLLDNLLNWAMQQQGHIPNVPEKLDLNEMANELVQVFSNMAQSKKIKMQVSIPENLYLWADRNSTMTIIRNLVNNALKFTPEGGEVTIAAENDGDMAKIIIRDTGVGIPQDKLKKLFQLQDRKSTYGTSGEKGLGLGLQLVYEFINMNNGKIAVESEEGKGTVFTLWLPIFEKEAERVAQ